MISIVLGTFFGDRQFTTYVTGKRESVLVVRFSDLVTLAAEPYLECRRTGPNTVLYLYVGGLAKMGVQYHPHCQVNNEENLRQGLKLVWTELRQNSCRLYESLHTA